MSYIQRRTGREVETVDQFDNRREARRMCYEYQLSDPSAHYYVSSRPCKDWR